MANDLAADVNWATRSVPHCAPTKTRQVGWLGAADHCAARAGQRHVVCLHLRGKRGR
jgi:hypothetical protein